MSERIQFTVRMVAALKPRGKKYFVREPRGFAVQVLPSGSKAYVYIFQLNKSKGYFLLGQHEAITLAEARDKFNAARALVKKGIDPRHNAKAIAEEKANEALRAAEKAAAATSALANQKLYTYDYILEQGVPKDFVPTTVEQLCAVWYVLYSKVNHCKEWQDTVLSSMQKHVIPVLGQSEITAIRHKHALSFIEDIATDAPGSARNTMKFCRQMFKYACRKEWSEIQPFHELQESVPKIAPKSKKRNLDDEELAQAWREITNSPSSNQIKRALKLILVTAQRPGEVAQMHYDQIKGKWWTIPEKVCGKNEREHRVFLTDTALGLIGEGNGHVFPSKRGTSGHISGNSLSQAINRGYLSDDVVKIVGKRSIKARKDPYFGMKPWSPHDLRRTARTNLARVGISNDVAEEVINHEKRGMVGVYNIYKYDKEKEEALKRWERLLLDIVQEQ